MKFSAQVRVTYIEFRISENSNTESELTHETENEHRLLRLIVEKSRDSRVSRSTGRRPDGDDADTHTDTEPAVGDAEGAVGDAEGRPRAAAAAAPGRAAAPGWEHGAVDDR